MKRIFAVLVIALMAASSAMAQKTFTTKSGVTFPANEISGSLFGANAPEMAMILGGVLAEAITAGNAEIDQIKSSGALCIDYDRYVCPFVAVGVSGSVEHYNMTYKDDTADGFKSTFFCLMPEVKLSWFRKEHVSMYSRIAAGAGYFSDDDNDFIFACQVSPVCLEAGGKNVKGFIELGYGMQGSGIGVRFGF